MRNPDAVSDSGRWDGDVLIIGAGPAGLASAAEVVAADRRILIVDENQRPGGQISRQRMLDPRATGDVAEPMIPRGVDFWGQTICHGFDADGAVVLTIGGRLVRARAKRTVIATGAMERVLPLPGWTLPGVMTAGAAQGFLKGSGRFPYCRVVVSGTGPLLLVAAADLVNAGVEVLAVTEAVRPRLGYWRDAVRTAAAPDLLLQGAGYITALRRAGCRILTGAAVHRIEGDDRVTGAVIGPLGPDWSCGRGPVERVDCDAVLLNHGFSSTVDLAAQRGADIEWDDQRQTWRPARDADFRTSIADVFAVGDCAGVGGVQTAMLEGRIAGIRIAAELSGATTNRRVLGRLRRRLARVETFRRGMDHIFVQGPKATDWAEPATEICRCQDVTRADIDEAIDHGATDLRSIKLWTRAGMGPCQGQICAPTLCALLAQRCGPAVDDARPSPRFPVRPMPLGVLAATGRHEEGRR